MWTGPRLGSVYSGPSMWAAELNCSSENSIIQAWSGFTPQYDVGFDKQLGSTNWKFDSKKKKEKKKWEHETRGRNVFAHVSLVNGVNREEECKTLITCAFHLSRCLFFTCRQYIVPTPPLPPAARCDTVCDNTNTSFCHCRRANRLIGLPCYPTQTVRPKESTAHFHNVIDRAPRRDAAWKYSHTPRVICMSITSQKPATLDVRQGEPIWSSAAHPTSSNHPHLHPHTPESQKKLESKAFWGDRK